ncbi:hypothetical protein D9619_011900 [Psilocybe cf. subviscida]|uniref:Uncharacterized protein n=1 Tax=Psilocybe cf. subviscida TaxID=2480587 RepID=A0A8H5B0N1_9AGAR|nr:hypothetical protein D9619_011900 [Psilocybe cf. subviscida]
MPLTRSTDNNPNPLHPGGIYLLLYIRDTDIAQGFHWALYHHHDGGRGGYKFNIRNFGGSGWICDSAPAANIMAGFLLAGALRIGHCDPGRAGEDLVWIDSVDLSVAPEPYGVLTCRTWTLGCVRGLVARGVVRCADVDKLEEEAGRWGVAQHRGAREGEQPRPVADSVSCMLG